MITTICLCIFSIILLTVLSVICSIYKRLDKKVDDLEDKLLDLKIEILDYKSTAGIIFEKETKRREALEEYLRVDYKPLNVEPAKYVKKEDK